MKKKKTLFIKGIVNGLYVLKKLNFSSNAKNLIVIKSKINLKINQYLKCELKKKNCTLLFFLQKRNIIKTNLREKFLSWECEG